VCEAGKYLGTKKPQATSKGLSC